MSAKSFQTIPNFFPQAKKLRSYFDAQFIHPHTAQPERFCWDYWYVRDQYCHMRTPAYHYFPSGVYQQFHKYLVQWGREHLGCHDVSPPWLSYYVDGHFQGWHADVPHGPWAFVYSLTPQSRLFRGGRTRIMKDSLLNYWQNILDSEGHEQGSFFEFIDPNFNQLLVFDARYPHSVEQVKNVLDPREGRLVIHGWFVEPRPYVVGGLSTSQVQKMMNRWMGDFHEWLSQQKCNFHGTLTLRLKINKQGQVKNYRLLTDTVKETNFSADRTVNQEWGNDLRFFTEKSLKNTLFPAAKAESLLTIPLIFK